MCLTICSGRPVAGSLKAVQLKRQHLSHMITFLRQFPTRHARQMALFQLVSNDCTSGTKGSTPCTGIIAVFLLQFVFCAFTWQMAAVVSSIRLALARCADRDLNGDGQSKAAAAADACEGMVALPPVFGDWNDAFIQYGEEASAKPFMAPSGHRRKVRSIP